MSLLDSELKRRTQLVPRSKKNLQIENLQKKRARTVAGKERRQVKDYSTLTSKGKVGLNLKSWYLSDRRQEDGYSFRFERPSLDILSVFIYITSNNINMKMTAHGGDHDL